MRCAFWRLDALPLPRIAQRRQEHRIRALLARMAGDEDRSQAGGDPDEHPHIARQRKISQSRRHQDQDPGDEHTWMN
jgi:hypothetical protein